MSEHVWNETFVEKEVTYLVEINGRIIAIEGVPVRVNIETGERLFAPQTVERIHEIIRLQQPPKKVIDTPVYEFAT